MFAEDFGGFVDIRSLIPFHKFLGFEIFSSKNCENIIFYLNELGTQFDFEFPYNIKKDSIFSVVFFFYKLFQNLFVR